MLSSTFSDKKLDKILEKLEDLEIKIEESKSDTYHSIMVLRAEAQEETTYIKRRLKKIEDKLDQTSGFLDKYLQETRRRVKRIEDHLDLPPLAT